MFNLYSHIEALAQEHGYQNVQELCKEAGIYPSVLSNLNKGRAKSITHKTAERLAKVLDVSVDVVYGRTPDISKQDIKAAFFNGENDLSQEEIDELWQETMDYLAFRMEQKKKKK